jgi:hypothetical protein
MEAYMMRRYPTRRDISQGFVLFFIIGFPGSLYVWIRDRTLSAFLSGLFILLFPSMFVVILGALLGKIKFRQSFSWVYVTEQGIHNNCCFCKSIFMRWDELCEISIGLFRPGKCGTQKAFCFTKSFSAGMRLDDLLKVPITENLVWVHYSDALYKDLLNYIDPAQFKNSHLIEKYVKRMRRKKQI